MLALQKRAAEAGTPLNWVADIHPQDDALKADDVRCKRYLSNKIKNIQQAVRGRGKTPRQVAVPAVTVYEKRLGKDLHAHQWLHIAPGNDALERFDDGLEVYVHRSHAKTADYLTKSRLPIGDAEAEANYPHKRQGGQAAIRGVHISFNADAKALLADARDTPRAAAPAPIVVAVPEPVAPPLSLAGKKIEPPGEPTQLAFDMPDAPQVNLAALINAERAKRRETQVALGAKLGIRQPHVANVLRGHDKLSPWVRNRALEWLGERRLVA